MGPITRHRGETLTLAATVGFPQIRGIPPGMRLLEIEVPSATLENISLALTPKIQRVWFYDDSATTKYIDLTAAMTDRNAAVGSGTNLNAMTTSDYLYVGCAKRFRGVAVDVDSANAVASVATWEYWNGSAWTDTSDTDGTASGGATLAVDGVVTWTVPTDWATTDVNGNTLYWVRMKVSVALTNPTSVLELVSLANLTISSANSNFEGVDYILLQTNNRTLPPYRFMIDVLAIGGVEMKSASITSAANLNWYDYRG